MIKLLKNTMVGFTVLSLMLLCGCAALSTSVSKRNLNVQTKMSSTIFLNPAPERDHVVYVQIHNTTGQAGMNVAPIIKEQLLQNGYRVTTRLSQAHYVLQANILRIGNTDKRDAERAASGGFGGALSGAAIGAGTGVVVGGGVKGAIAGGIIGGVAGTIIDALVKDQVYIMITDVQISVRVPRGTVAAHTRSVTRQGTSSRTVATSNTTPGWQRYRTRIVSTAEKVNLKFAQARPVLVRELAHAIAGIF